MNTIDKIQKQLETPMKVFKMLTGEKYLHKQQAKRINCVNGTQLSVQASRTHYSVPKSNYGPYSHVEVGAWNPTIYEGWEQYLDSEPNEDGFTVYARVPIKTVAQFIDQCGGIKE